MTRLCRYSLKTALGHKLWEHSWVRCARVPAMESPPHKHVFGLPSLNDGVCPVPRHGYRNPWTLATRRQAAAATAFCAACDNCP